jgi:hypothetical protein
MKRSILTLIATMVISILGYSQAGQEIIYEKAFGGYKYSQNGIPIGIKQMSNLMSSNAEASDYISKAKTNYGASMVFNYAGGFLIGWPIGTALGGGEPEWEMVAVGGGLVLLSIPFIKAANTNAIKAIDIYNANSGGIGARTYSLKFGLNSGGVGVTIKF